MEGKSGAFQVFLQNGAHICFLKACNIGGIFTPFTLSADHLYIKHGHDFCRIKLMGKIGRAKSSCFFGGKGGENQGSGIIALGRIIFSQLHDRSGPGRVIIGPIINTVFFITRVDA